MIMKPVIKWSGSKRSQALKIKSFFPKSFDTYYEPFVGGGSILYTINPKKSICGDICKPLINLWLEIKNNPVMVVKEYRERWLEFQKKGSDYFYEVRNNFNQTKSPYDFLFLSRTCTNGLIRFNKKGEFNNSLHFSRKGINPKTLKNIIIDWSNRVKNTEFINDDYSITTSSAKSGDVIYLDPPYFHTKGMYYGNIDFDKFLEYLENLNQRGIKFLLSYDGKRGKEDHTVEIPKELYKRHEYLLFGNSSFKQLHGVKEMVFESLYLNF